MTDIPRSDEFHFGFDDPLYAVHNRGTIYAVFAGANQALAFQRGEDSGWFHIENAEGETVVIKDQPRYPGHAYAILEALDRA